MSEYLFVYGTLRTGLRPTEVMPLLAELTLVSAATVSGRLYDFGEYPGVVLEYGFGSVTGELYELGDLPTHLSAFDSYEEFDGSALSQSLFVRTKCRATLPSGQSVEAWIYVYNQSLNAARLIESGDYAEVAARLLLAEISN